MQTLKTDTRKRILAVSRSLFLEKGFQGATTREIAAASGVTLSNLYHYYPSKDALFRVLVTPATDALEMLLAERHGRRDTISRRSRRTTMRTCSWKSIWE